MNENQAMAVLHRVRDDILVGPAPVEQVIAAAASRQRNRRIALAAAAAVAVVAGAGAVVALQDDDSERPEPAVRLVENPAPVAWWGDGWLHVAHAAVETPRPDLIVPVSDGVVTWSASGDDSATVVHVSDDGRQTTIGTATRGGNPLAGRILGELASDPGAGWVAWVDHPAGKPPVLVVHDTGPDEEIARQELGEDGPRRGVLDEGPYPIAIEDGVVYYASWDADYRWDVANDGEPAPVTDSTTYLLARQAGVEMTRPSDPQGGYGDPVISQDGEPGVQFPYDLGLLSPDGRYGAGLTNIGSSPRIYDLESQDRLPTGMGRQAVDDIAFGPDGTVTYAVSTPWERPEDFDLAEDQMPEDLTVAPYELITCEIATAECETVVGDIGGGEDLVLSD